MPSLADLPDPGIKLGSPALQVDSLPTELPRKPWKVTNILLTYNLVGFVHMPFLLSGLPIFFFFTSQVLPSLPNLFQHAFPF